MQNLFAKTAGVVVAVALLVGVAVPAANAYTASDITALLVGMGLSADQAATIAALLGSSDMNSSGSSYNFTRDLTIGSTGADVVALQEMLVSAGYLTIPVGVSKGYFGSLTQSALASWQASIPEISPNSGYFGPITRSYIASMSTPDVIVIEDEDDGPSGLQGGEGYFEIDEILDADVELDLGETEIVMEFEVEAIDSDIEIDRVDFMFDARPWLYFDEVRLLVDGDEVDSLSNSGDFREVGADYRARFTDVDFVIEEDDKVEFALELVVLDSMSGTRDTDTVNVELGGDAVRGFDGDGINQEGPATADAISLDVTFDEAFGDGDVQVTLGDGSPDNETIVLDNDTRTNDVTVLEFEIEAEDSDIEVTDVTVTFATSSGATTSVAQLVNRARLYSGSTLLDTQSVNDDSVVFDDIEFDIEEDDIETLTVEVDFNETEGLTLGEFEVVSVKVDAENGDYVAIDDTLTVNEEHTLVVEGLIETDVSKSASTQQLGDDTIAIFTFDIELSAVENTFYIAEDGTGFTVTLDNASTSIISTTVSSDASTVDSGNSYRISKGQSETFAVQVQVQSATGTQAVRSTVASLQYFDNTTLTTGTSTVTLGSPDYRSVSKTVYKN